MAFFVGDLVVSVFGCFVDEKAGHLVDPCVELSVGNKLHSTTIPLEVCDGGYRATREFKLRSPAVAFHGVTEEDVLTVTLLDRSSPYPPDGGGEAFIAEAEPLLCTHWGSGGRPTLRTCLVAPPEEVLGFPWGGGGGGQREGKGGGGGREGESGSGSTVQLAICWSPAIRLKKPLSFVAEAGRVTGRVVSRKIDWPVSAVLNLGLDAAAHASCLVQTPCRRAVALIFASISLSLGSAFLAIAAAVAAFFLPVTLTMAAAAAAATPPVLAMSWIAACTSPACEQLWRPLLVWAGIRSNLMRRALLFAIDEEEEGGEEAGAGGGAGGVAGGALGGGREALRGAAGGGGGARDDRRTNADELAPNNRLRDAGSRRNGEGYRNLAAPGANENAEAGTGGGAGVGAVVLLMACCQNLMGVLHTGLEASRWRPRSRER